MTSLEVHAVDAAEEQVNTFIERWRGVDGTELANAQSERPRKYWSDLKGKLIKEGSEVSDKIGQLKIRSADGKSYLTDVVDTETLLRLIQSIPSPSAEPFKLWLAQVGYKRLEENDDPELTIERALATYLAKGYSREWINQRL